MFLFARTQFRRLALQGNHFVTKLPQSQPSLSKCLSKPINVFRTPGNAQYFSSRKARPSNSPSAFRRGYSSLGARIDRIDSDKLVYGILGINVAVFGCIQFALMERNPAKRHKIHQFIRDNLAFSNLNLKMGRVWTLVTAGFTHEDFWHLLVNSVTIYFFGPSVRCLQAWIDTLAGGLSREQAVPLALHAERDLGQHADVSLQ